jgi:hypothetical protein
LSSLEDELERKPDKAYIDEQNKFLSSLANADTANNDDNILKFLKEEMRKIHEKFNI